MYAAGSKSAEEKLIKIKPVIPVHNEPQQLDEGAAAGSNEDVQRELDAAYEQLKHIKNEQHQLLDETRQIIAREKRIWEDEKQRYITEVEKTGHEQGFAAGKQEGLGTCKEMLDTANMIVKAAQKDYEAELQKSTGSILDLAVHIAGKIIRQHLSEKPELFLPLVTEALQEIKNRRNIILYLHPDDYIHVVKQKEELAHVVEDATDMTILADGEAQQGHCLIEHSSGQIDAGIDTQLEEIRQILHETAAVESQ
jgi:flagellar assembly protein FliH